MTTNAKRIGNDGEQYAKKVLIEKGFQFEEENYYGQWGEIDLVFFDKEKNEFMLVEVKTRKENSFVDILESISKKKIKKIIRTGMHYFLKKRGFREVPPFRVDAMLITHSKEGLSFEYIENLTIY